MNPNKGGGRAGNRKVLHQKKEKTMAKEKGHGGAHPSLQETCNGNRRKTGTC